MTAVTRPKAGALQTRAQSVVAAAGWTTLSSNVTRMRVGGVVLVDHSNDRTGWYHHSCPLNRSEGKRKRTKPFSFSATVEVRAKRTVSREEVRRSRCFAFAFYSKSYSFSVMLFLTPKSNVEGFSVFLAFGFLFNNRACCASFGC